MSWARCGVCMKSGSKASQKRLSKTGSPSGRDFQPFFRVQHRDFAHLYQFFTFNWHIFIFPCPVFSLNLMMIIMTVLNVLVFIVCNYWGLLLQLCFLNMRVICFTGVKHTYLRSFYSRGRIDFGSWNSRPPCLWNFREKWTNTRSRPTLITFKFWK